MSYQVCKITDINNPVNTIIANIESSLPLVVEFPASAEIDFKTLISIHKLTSTYAPIVLLTSKWDIVDQRSKSAYLEYIRRNNRGEI